MNALDEPVITYTVQTPADARRQHHIRAARRAVIGAAFVAAILTPSPFDGEDNHPAHTVAPAVVEVTATPHTLLR